MEEIEDGLGIFILSNNFSDCFLRGRDNLPNLLAHWFYWFVLIVFRYLRACLVFCFRPGGSGMESLGPQGGAELVTLS